MFLLKGNISFSTSPNVQITRGECDKIPRPWQRVPRWPLTLSIYFFLFPGVIPLVLCILNPVLWFSARTMVEIVGFQLREMKFQNPLLPAAPLYFMSVLTDPMNLLMFLLHGEAHMVRKWRQPLANGQYAQDVHNPNVFEELIYVNNYIWERAWGRLLYLRIDRTVGWESSCAH